MLVPQRKDSMSPLLPWRWEWRGRITLEICLVRPSPGLDPFPILRKQRGHGEDFMAPC